MQIRNQFSYEWELTMVKVARHEAGKALAFLRQCQRWGHQYNARNAARLVAQYNREAAEHLRLAKQEVIG